MNIQEYTKQLDELITSKFELRNQAHTDFNISWKHKNKFEFAMKMVRQKEDEISKLVSSFKDIEYIKKSKKK